MTLQADLQKLSNTTLDSQGAANTWAGTLGLDLLGALNLKAGTTGLALNGVLRVLAGKTGEADTILFGYIGGEEVPLTAISYKPGTDITTTTTSTTFVDVDATNLAVTFTVPSSGAVIVKMNGVSTVATSGNSSFWGLRDGAAVVADSEAWMMDAAQYHRYQYSQKFTGLTPGVVHIWKWAQRVSGGVTPSTSLRYGSALGPAVMEVWSA